MEVTLSIEQIAERCKKFDDTYGGSEGLHILQFIISDLIPWKPRREFTWTRDEIAGELYYNGINLLPLVEA